MQQGDDLPPQDAAFQQASMEPSCLDCQTSYGKVLKEILFNVGKTPINRQLRHIRLVQIRFERLAYLFVVRFHDKQ